MTMTLTVTPCDTGCGAKAWVTVTNKLKQSLHFCVDHFKEYQDALADWEWELHG